MAELFGPSVKHIIQDDPPAVPNEAELLKAVVQKVGPYADKDKLQYHIRISAGKVHWAVNSYFRNILVAAASTQGEDFDSKPNRNAQLLTRRLETAEQHVTAGGLQDIAAAACRSAAGRSPLQPVGSSAAAMAQPQVAQHQQPGLSNETGSLSSAAPCGAPAIESAAENVLLEGLPANVLEVIMSYLDVHSLLQAASSCKTLLKAAQSEQIWRCLFHQRWGAVIFPTNKYGTGSNRGALEPRASQAETRDMNRTAAQGGSLAASLSQDAAVVAESAAKPGLSEVVKAPPAAVDAGAMRAPASQSTTVRGAAQASTPCRDGGHSGAAVQTYMQGAVGSPASSDFVSRWTGSYLPGKTTVASKPAHAVGDTLQPDCAASSNSCLCSCHKHRQQDAGAESCSCSCGGVLPVHAPAGSWKVQYKQQYSYQAVRRCPKCGDAPVVPVVYGFPSVPLLVGMRKKRLVLGGDHLIEACHVWACSGCRSCYRFFPYADVQLWIEDDKKQHSLDRARVAAGRSRRQSGNDGIGNGQQQGNLDALPGEEEAAAAGLPPYTYEL